MNFPKLLAALAVIGALSTLSAQSKDTNPKVPASNPGGVQSLCAKAKLSLKDAEDIALKEVPGRTRRAELEYEDGVLQYDFEICLDRVKKGVRVDANSGRVIEVERQFGYCDKDED